ncbi:PQQ-binding-like beta-propeller repeat protein [Botrimarina mediterranea]|uniref:Outer membrane biogenesis protein BamB n=1 Tax=Botrimarina mediterranea TaxID=2528022 RepID=A0A518K9V4_9BACT|nr:PQQ-binding-like beta-propeller repeat protein [Botrimarina mediterranea]QDV74569.1 outer membrane biogenesis protein BamB [Botrimarina mediterranea]
MATAKQFLEAIELQKLVSSDVLDELYEEYRASGGAITAEALAKKLQSRGLITDGKAATLLQASSESFIQVGSGILNPANPTPVAPDDPFDSDLETKKTKGGVKRDAAGRRKHVQKSHKNDFDSPLLLLGGGALALLALGGIALVVVMNLQSGDQLLESAQSAYASGSYAQAREVYEEFVEDFEGNARWSEARVKLAVVRLRQQTETASDWPAALATAQQELPQIEDEEAFSENRGEFASILPRIARGLADSADRASGGADFDNEKVEGLVNQATEALTLVNNTKYVPKSLRDEREVTAINDLLDRVARRREALDDLGKTLTAIEAATSSGDIEAAYKARTAFVDRRPELRDDPRLAEKLAAAVEAERSQVKFTPEPADAVTTEAESPVALALPLVNPRRDGAATADGVFTATFHGVTYAVNAADGTLAWRRPVGVRLAETNAVTLGDDRLLLDHRSGELVRVNAATGELIWRTPVEGPEAPLFEPTIAGERVLVASESGRLWSFDAASGARVGATEFAQPLRSAPAIDAETGRAYVAGQQSSLYTLDTESLECIGVRFTGHAPGTVLTPPLAIGGRVAIIENTGAETSRLSVYATDESGVVGSQLGEWRLEGIVSTPAVVSARRFLVATESGAVYLFEVTAAKEGAPLTLIASQPAQPGEKRRRSVVESRGEVWIAGEGLRRTAASLADSRLAPRDLPDACTGDLFVGPIVKNGDAVLHARVRKGAPGLTVAASDSRTGRLLWETDLAAPPLGAPIYSDSARAVVASTVTGQSHLIGPPEVRARQSTQPDAEPSRPQVFDAVARLASTDSALAKMGGGEWLAVRVAPRAGSRAVSLPGELACEPVTMGEGVLTPLAIGQVHLLDLAGQPLATPFQPRVAAGSPIQWTKPAVAGPVAVLTDGAETVYCLAIDSSASASLVERASAKLPTSAAPAAAAIVGQQAVVALADNSLAAFSLPSLDASGTLPLPGAIVWGPYAAGDVALLATADELVAVNPSSEPAIAWRAPLDNAKPVGEPLVDGDGVAVAFADGRLVRFASASGDASATLELGQPLGSGPTAYGPRWLVSAADGAVLVVTHP